MQLPSLVTPIRATVLVLAAFLVIEPLGAADKLWTGAISNLWSVSGNWSGAVAPADGDALTFPLGSANMSTVNDLANLDLASLTFEGPSYQVGGNALTLSAGLNGM